MRVDGVLRELTHIPAELTASLVSRVKILADMDIAERRTPQDGRFLVQIGSKELDLRVSTLPTRDGEKVVLRLLDPSSVLLRFEDLGFSAPNARTLGGLLEKPQGMLLVTGPTGSGKTTTLYADLNQLRSPSVNVITIEDPIEYRLQDINQVQINPKAGLTFATCVRAMLRQDPNIIMVGEIRDTETAEIALQAAQTGHLVLSTLHTNDSVSAVTRLIDLSIPGFLISSSVTGILGQRLVRKLCSCRDQAPLSSEYRSRLRAVGVEDFDDRMFIQIGCGDCDNTGYKGRVGIFELLVIDDRIRSELRSGVTPEHEIRAVATGTGMKLMHEDALDKVRAGLTTLDEVLRVVPFEHAIATRCGACGQALSPGFLFCPYCGVSTRQRTAGGRAEAIGPLSATEVCVDEHLA
jgi:type II secretory ATPase GspE/PulE/Tfp pilus assembly ATPase PilB-like protein